MEMGLGDHCPRGILDTKDSMRRKPFYGVTNLRPPNLQILKPVGGAHESKRVSKSLKFKFSWHSYVGKIPKDATNLVGPPLPTKTQTIKCYEHRSGNQLPGSTDPAKNTELVLTCEMLIKRHVKMSVCIKAHCATAVLVCALQSVNMRAEWPNTCTA